MPYKVNESKRHHIPKQQYKLKNWPEYNQALKHRGRIDLWLDKDITSWWYHDERIFDGTGSSQLYTDLAIRACHEIRMVFKLPLRQTEGFINSLFEQAGLPLKCPDYSLLSKRLKGLKIPLSCHKKQGNPLEALSALALDSTGLKRFGRDEWHQEKHNVSSKRSWRKLHLGVGEDHYIHAAVLTNKDAMDDSVVADLCEQVDAEVQQVSGDKAYDETHVYETLERHFPGAKIAIPPRDRINFSDDLHPQRRSNMLEIAAKGALSWQKMHAYGKRNHSEMAMKRYKGTFGNRMHARDWDNQKQEARIGCRVLNHFTRLGMPQSYRTV